VTFSEQFDNAAWDKTGVTVTANNAVSPDGFTNADLLTADGANSIHDIFQLFAGGTANSVSIFVKKGTARYINVVTNYVSTGSDWVSVVFDLDTLTSNVDQAGGLTSISVKIEDYGNGYYRLVSNTNAATATTLYVFYGIVDAANPTRGSRGRVALTSSATIIAWGAQVEAGSYVSSYIPTLGSSVTRLADAASKTGISSLIGQTAGTLYAHWTCSNANTSGRILAISDGGFTNRIAILEDAGTIRLFISASSVVQADLTNLGSYSGTHKIAVAYANNDLKVYLDGVAVATTTTLTVPACSAAYVGTLEDGTNATALNGGIFTSALYTTRLSNAELAQLTSL
jgi:hypothetical protein